MKLGELIEPRWWVQVEKPETEITGVTADSRTVRPGDLFVVMPSVKGSVAQYAEQAIANGAAAVLLGKKTLDVLSVVQNFPHILLTGEGHSYFATVGRICSQILGDPTSKLRVIGVTGTNGKTTTAWMIRCALQALGRKPAYLGTIGINLGGETRELNNTTPFPVELWQLIQEVVDAGCTDLVMEVSSHALHQRRLAGVRFDCGVFTNLTQDHLDYHGTMDEYADAKQLFFTEYAMASGKPFIAALNLRDPYGRMWANEIPVPSLTFGGEEATFVMTPGDVRVDSLDLRVGYHGLPCTVPAGGNFNVENSCAAATCLASLGYRDEEIVTGLQAITPVPGRFEAVRNTLGIGVLVDYAHTPDALLKVLESARALQPKRLIAVFGCGGDRDRTKRPLMAGVASSLADYTVVTSDNPRTEDPQSILDEVRSGIKDGAESTAIIDRSAAIEHAIQFAESGDIVVIAGKGHENYQIIGHTKHHMDDREMAREALVAKGSE